MYMSDIYLLWCFNFIGLSFYSLQSTQLFICTREALRNSHSAQTEAQREKKETLLDDEEADIRGDRV